MLYFALLLMTLIGSTASFFLKQAAGSETLTKLLNNPSFYIGGGLYLGSAIINIFLLKYFDYSIVLPMTSLTYVWTMLISYLILKERITKRKIFGVCMVIVGAIVISL